MELVATPCHTPWWLFESTREGLRIYGGKKKIKVIVTLAHEIFQFGCKDFFSLVFFLIIRYFLPPFRHGRMARGGHGRMARGGHGLSKVSTRPAKPKPSTPCGQATPEKTLQPFQGLPAHGAGSLQPSSTPLDTPHRAPILSATFPSSL
jgi:hypothetical protein